MKGQSELTATFVKLVQIGLVVVGALAIFFTYINYEIMVYQSSVERESYLLGNSLMASNCFTDGTKGLFIQSKLDFLQKNCFLYPGKFKIISASFEGEYELVPKASYSEKPTATFDALIKLSSGITEPAKLEVYV